MSSNLGISLGIYVQPHSSPSIWEHHSPTDPQGPPMSLSVLVHLSIADVMQIYIPGHICTLRRKSCRALVSWPLATHCSPRLIRAAARSCCSVISDTHPFSPLEAGPGDHPKVKKCVPATQAPSMTEPQVLLFLFLCLESLFFFFKVSW